MNVTIKHIARKANVSYSTVSRAINNKYGVWPKTREKILRIADQLNYSPNAIARGLKEKRTKTIGLIIPDIANPFFPEVARGIEDEAKKYGNSVFLCNTNWNRESEEQYVRLLAERRVDGFIIASACDGAEKAEGRPLPAIPAVYVSNVPQGTTRSFVVIDNLRGGFLATQHLIEAGYTKIAFVGAVEQSQPVDQRLQGYKLALESGGLLIDDGYIKVDHYGNEQAAGYRMVRDLLEGGNPPRAVFAENDLLALGVINGVRSLGRAVPEDVAVVGFDDIPFASYQEVGLTTVSQPKYEMGRMAVRILLDEIEAAAPVEEAGPDGRNPEASGSRKRVVLEPKLLVRKTSIVVQA